MTYPEEGKTPCWYCFDEDEDYELSPENIGTSVEPDCGDGCCHIRERCTECYGTGYSK